MRMILVPLFSILDVVLELYVWAVIASAVLSWLVAFRVVNTGNKFVYAVGDFLYRITEPALRRIRPVVPNLGGVDLSPLILILAIAFLRMVLHEILRLIV